jgi:hypothetical protein
MIVRRYRSSKCMVTGTVGARAEVGDEVEVVVVALLEAGIDETAAIQMLVVSDGAAVGTKWM